MRDRVQVHGVFLRSIELQLGIVHWAAISMLSCGPPAYLQHVRARGWMDGSGNFLMHAPY